MPLKSIRGKSFAYYYEKLILPAEINGLSKIRRDLVSPAFGDVLEIGVGNANNARCFDLERIRTYSAIDTNPHMLKSADATLKELWGGDPAPDLRQGTAEAIPYPDQSFDVVVATFFHCSVPNPAAALEEIHRVLRPGGKYLFLEHVISIDNPRLARVQRNLTPAQRFLFHGCRLDLDFPALLAESKFSATEAERGTLPKSPHFLRPLYLGSTARL